MSNDPLIALDRQLLELGLRANDITEQFTRSGGPGGQHVNRTSTAVLLCHVPSGVSVRVESERSQLQNRIAARELLIKKIITAREAARQKQIAERERKRRQRRRPPPAARRKNVENKRRRGSVKQQRQRVAGAD